MNHETVERDDSPEGKDARSSVRIATHKPDPPHELNLLRMMQVANEHTVRELGSLPPGGLPVVPKRKPNLPRPEATVPAPVNLKNEEKETMKFSHLAAATALMAMGIAACNSTTQASASESKTASMPIADAQESAHPLIRGSPGSKPPGSWDESSQSLDAIETEVPPGFDSFGPPTSIGDNRHCMVGAVTDEDGMNERPYVYIANASGKRDGWVKPLNIPRNFYESVAKRCLRKGDALYVLQSSNTLMQPSLSQTLLRLVKLNLANGHIDASIDVEVPGVGGAYSTWVDKSPKGLTSSSGGVVVSGEYFFQGEDKDDRHFPFTVEFTDNLIPVK